MLSEQQREVLAARLRQGRADAAGGVRRRPAGVAELPLSFGQQQLWFMNGLAPDSPVYNIPAAVRLCGRLDAAALGCALDELVARHEALRTRVVCDADGRPLQVVDDPAGAGLTQTDLADLDPAEREMRLGELVMQEAAQPFDLAAGPLLRVRLIRLAADEHVLVLVVHHIVFDGWSSGVFFRELIACYEAALDGRAPQLAELPVQFADYALWERERLHGTALDELARWWRENLDGFQTLQLPADRPRPVVASYQGGSQQLKLGRDVLDGLRELSHREGTTLFVTLLAALQALLQRYTGQDGIVIGTVTANRSKAKLASLIGYLVNTLAIRTDLSGDPQVSELVGRVREATVGAYAHQDLPFAKLVELLRVERDPSRAPVFQVMFTAAEARPDISLPGLTVHAEESGLAVAKFDLSFAAEIHTSELWLELSYATALFDAASARRMLYHLAVLLAGLAAHPTARLSQLPVLTTAERHQELAQWNNTAADLPQGCLHQHFEQQASHTPDAIAAEIDGHPVSYAQLNTQANQIARRLHELGVGPEVLAGVSMTPSTRRLAVLLAIMKAGGGYVPLDPALPRERLTFMTHDAAMKVIITDDTSEPQLPTTSTPVLQIDRQWPQITTLDPANPHYPAHPANVAYVIYTSGSTGQPKGVAVEHRQAMNTVTAMISHWPITPRHRLLQFASLNFDVSVLDMFLALLSGARLVLVPQQIRLSPPQLARLIRDRQVTYANLPPAVVSLLTGQHFPDLKILVSAGEAMPSDLARKWLKPGLRLCNAYGPTEDAVLATHTELDGTLLPPPIGRPLANQQAYVLDRHLNPVPAGVIGELHLGGTSITRGYLNSPALTAQRFIADPFSPHPGTRLYKTGDLVRRLPDGNITYLGRADGQVKIRGIRIELGDIEAALATHPAVAQAIVVATTDHDSNKQLAGYVRCRPGQPHPPTTELREHLATRLPAAMLPASLQTIDTFPVNTSGKIDKTRLPTPPPPQPTTSYTPPRTLAETMLTDLYARLLSHNQIGIDDSFFDLGGNSLQAMQLITQIETHLAPGTDINVAAIFLAPTPRQLAARIELIHGSDGHRELADVVVELSTGAGIEPLFVIHAIGGTVYSYASLARELADTFKVYGVAARQPGAGSAAADSLPAMAAAYAEAIRVVQAEGPYRLVGWSMGGLLAFEIAKRLERTGDAVFLGLLDTPFDPPDLHAATPPQLAARFAADVAETCGWDAPDAPDPAASSVDEQLTRLAEQLRADGTTPEVLVQEVGNRFEMFRAHALATAGYRPEGKVSADALVISASHSPNALAGRHWAQLVAGDVSVTCIDCDHYAFLRPPLVRQVAGLIMQSTFRTPCSGRN